MTNVRVLSSVIDSRVSHLMSATKSVVLYGAELVANALGNDMPSVLCKYHGGKLRG